MKVKLLVNPVFLMRARNTFLRSMEDLYFLPAALPYILRYNLCFQVLNNCAPQ